LFALPQNSERVKLEWRAKNINRNLEQLLLVPFGFLKDVLHQKMTIVILFKEMVLSSLHLETDIQLKQLFFFVATADAGSTRPGKEYEMKYMDDHGNVCVQLI
jgi:hypothetical protein